MTYKVHKHQEGSRHSTTRYSEQPPALARCQGGLTLSLDLKQAFDRIDRTRIAKCLSLLKVDPALIHLIMQWHQQTKYYIELGTAIPTNTGVRQGCVIAPILWRVYSHCWALDLSVHRPSLPITYILSMFADDYLFCWNILDALDFTSALSDVRYIIHHLRTWTLEPSLGKTRLLVRVCGAQSPFSSNSIFPVINTRRELYIWLKGRPFRLRTLTHT